MPSGKEKFFDAWKLKNVTGTDYFHQAIGPLQVSHNASGIYCIWGWYTRRVDEIFADFPCKTKCVDDTCMWGDSIEECFFQACQWLDLCGRNGFILNPDKFSFNHDVVEFGGLEITLDEVK